MHWINPNDVNTWDSTAWDNIKFKAPAKTLTFTCGESGARSGSFGDSGGSE